MSVKISAMTAIGTLAAEDLFEVVDDPSGTPLTRKATGTQVSAMVGTTLGLGAGSVNEIAYSDGSGGLSYDADLTWDGAKIDFKTAGASRAYVGIPSWDGSYLAIQNGTLAEAAANSALYQNPTGTTVVNAAAGASVRTRINNADQLAITDGTADFQDCNITTSGSITTTGSDLRVDRSGDTADAILYLDSDAGENSNITLRTGTTPRWYIGKSADPETGSDAGSDLLIQRYSDAGALQDRPISISRNTGDVTIANLLAVSGTGFSSFGGGVYFNGDLNFLVNISTNRPLLQFDAQDYLMYNRTSNALQFYHANAKTLDFTASTFDLQGVAITTTGGVTADNYIIQRTGDGADGYVDFYVDAGLDSWVSHRDGGTLQWESGSDGGSNTWELKRYVGGVLQDRAISVANSTGDVTIVNDLNVSGIVEIDRNAVGGTYNSVADDFIIATSSDAGMTIRSGSTNYGAVSFADGDAGSEQYRGILRYDHNTDQMEIFAAGSLQFDINNTTADFHDNNITTTGRVDIGTAPTVDLGADEFVIGGAGSVGMSIISGATSASAINFGDTADTNIGQIEYSNSTNDMRFRVGAAYNFTIGTAITSAVNHDFSAGIDVTGNITTTGDLSLTTAYSSIYFDGGSSDTDCRIYASSANDIVIASAHVRAEFSLGLRNQRGSYCGMEAGSGGADLQIASGNVNVFNVDDAPTATLTIANHNVDMGQGLDVTGDITATGEITSGNIFINEGASASADVAGDGQLWVKSDTPNRIMFTDDAGTDINLQTGYELLATGSLSGSTAIDITGYTGFRILKLVVIGATVTTDGNNVEIDFSFDGGSTYASDSWDKTYHSVGMGDTAALIGTAAASGTMYLTGPIGDLSSEYANATMEFFGATQAVQTWATGECMNINASAVKQFQRLSGVETTTDVVDYIRITESSLDGGTYHLYGVRN